MYPNIVTARTAIELLVLLLVAAAGSVVRSHPRLHSRLIRAPPALGVGNVQVLLVDRLDRSDSSHQLSRRSFEQVQDLDTELDASSELSEGVCSTSLSLQYTVLYKVYITLFLIDIKNSAVSDLVVLTLKVLKYYN